MTKAEARARIEAVGIIPAIRLASAADAHFAAETIAKAGIPIVEITMTVPGALQVIARLTAQLPSLIVGAGTVLDAETARRTIGAGAHFVTSPGLVPTVVESALKADVLAIPGALTPTEVAAASRAGADFVKVFPCALVGGDAYIRALKAPFPDVPLIAAGGVTAHSAADFIRAGAEAIGVGTELVPRLAVTGRQADWIAELARRFVAAIKEARASRLKYDVGVEQE
jgi:2-dehydro-3-deoxyphosphogluconate aldolase/(4S)-4-hydroxy-2-oxoglutarate aldolase